MGYVCCLRLLIVVLWLFKCCWDWFELLVWGLVGGLRHGVCGGLLFCYLFWFGVGLRLSVLCLTCSVVYGLLLYVGGWVS